jgi:hypothetical protein
MVQSESVAVAHYKTSGRSIVVYSEYSSTIVNIVYGFVVRYCTKVLSTPVQLYFLPTHTVQLYNCTAYNERSRTW